MALGRGMQNLRGLEALASVMSKPVSVRPSKPKSSSKAVKPDEKNASKSNQGLTVDEINELENNSYDKELDNKNLVGSDDLGLEGTNDQRDTVTYLELSKIVANPKQPRKRFEAEDLEDLVASIESVGLLQPIVVRPVGDNYEIVAGERRWRAAQQAKLSLVPTIIRKLADKEAFQLALIENVQRQQLNPIEEARAYLRLCNDFSMTQEEVSRVVGKKRASIANTMRLINLDAEVVESIERGEISQGHAKVILSVKDRSAQRSLARKIINEGLSVRAVEEILPSMFVLDRGRAVKQGMDLLTDAKTNSPKSAQDYEVLERLRSFLGTKIKIKSAESGRGKIIIEYFSDQELQRVVDLITNKDPFDF